MANQGPTAETPPESLSEPGFQMPAYLTAVLQSSNPNTNSNASAAAPAAHGAESASTYGAIMDFYGAGAADSAARPPTPPSLSPSLSLSKASLLRAARQQPPQRPAPATPSLFSRPYQSGSQAAFSDEELFSEFDPKEVDDDEEPLGLVAAQLINASPRQQQPQQQQQPQSSSAPRISNILSSIASNAKVLDELDNATPKDLESLEGLVGQLGLLLQNRKRESARESATIASSQRRPPKLDLNKDASTAESSSDEDGDDVPLGQIHSTTTSKPTVLSKDDDDDNVPLMARVPTRNAFTKSKKMESFAPMSPTRPTSTPIRPPTPSIPAPSAPPPLETVPPAPTTTPAQPAQLTLPKPEPRKVTTRIYIESLSSYKTVILTNQLQADTVISELICILGSAFVDDGSWTLFEVCNDFGIERPLRDWEIVTDILEAWDPTTSTNVLILKPYGFRNTLVPRCIIGKWPRVEGRFDIEVKLGKWKRKYFILKEDSIYYKEREFDRETWLCRLNNFDVYTLTTPRKRATTQYCFALRSASSVTMFENMAEYIHFFCVDTKDQLADWVLGIRLAKNESTFAELPDMFADYENIPARNQPPLRQAIGGATHQLTTTGTLLDTAEIVPPTTAVTSLLSRSLSQRKMSQPNLSHVNQAVPAKPLLQFSQTPIYQHPGAKQEQQGDAQDVPMGRTKSKMTRQFSAQRRATVGTFVPLPVSQQQSQQQQQQQQQQQAFDADNIIFEAADMGYSQVPTSIESYDEAYIRDMQLQMERAWESEQQATLGLVLESQKAKKLGGGGDGPGDGPIPPGRLSSSSSTDDVDPVSVAAPGLTRSKSKRVTTPGRTKTVTAPAPLIDVSDSKNCTTCGCSEFKTWYNQSNFGTTKDGKKVCGNCRHPHK